MCTLRAGEELVLVELAAPLVARAESCEPRDRLDAEEVQNHSATACCDRKPWYRVDTMPP